LDKLTIANKFINATQVVEVLSRRAERSPSTALRALAKLTLPRAGSRGLAPRPMLDQDTAVQAIRLATVLVPLLFQDQSAKPKKSIPRTLLEIVSSAVEPWPVPAIGIGGLEFLRAIERHVSWTEIEKAPMEGMRNSLLRLPALIIPDLLERGALVEATRLSERVRLSGAAEGMFKTAVNECLTKHNQLPLASQNWAMRFLQPENVQETVSLTPS